jgi:hypothetical protein
MRLIDADELKTAFPCGEEVRTESVRATIDHAPTVPQRMRGRWIEYPEVLAIADALDDTYIGCSCCKNVFNVFDNDTERFLFCPNCGAQMENGGNNG